jgi:hypothetical protein
MRPSRFVLMTVATVAGVALLTKKTGINIPGFH